MIMTENTTQHAHEMNKDGLGRYAEVHGLKMYYEIHGEGFPLVLLHGGLSTIDTSFGKVLPGLAGGTAGHRHRAASPWAHRRQ
jgi:pimeloyl-ACP methyl ester carboxylesterase